MNINHRLTYNEKIANKNEYGRQMMDWMADQSRNYNYINSKMIINYNLYNGKPTIEDMKKYISTEIDDEMLAKVQHYDIMVSKLRTIIGEMLSRNLSYQVVSTNKDAVNLRIAKLDSMVKDHGTNLITKLREGYTPEMLEHYNKDNLKRISKFIKSEFKLKSEIEANNILKYHNHKQNYKELFIQGVEHAIINAVECYWVGIKNEPVIEVLNLLNLRYQISPDLKNIQDADWACYEYYMTLTDTYNYVSTFIKDEQGYEDLDNLSSNNYNPNANYLNQLRNYIEWNTTEKSYPNLVDPENKSHVTINTIIPTFKHMGLNLVKVIYGEWKSLRKVGSLHRKQGNQIIKDIVNEDYKLDKSLGDIKIEWYWIPEVWRGIRIGDSGERMYLNVGPKEEQFNDIENPHSCKLGFVGRIYNYVNGEPLSLLDRAKPYQYLYSIISLQIERILASDIGKVLMVDVNAIPDDMDYPDFAYTLKTFKIAPFDTSKAARHRSNFQGFGSTDLSMAREAISQRIELLMFLQQRCAEVMGITKEREGRVNQNSNVSDNQQSVIQSNYITENEFFQHEICIKNVLSQFLEVCKTYYKENPLEAVMLDNNSPLNIVTEDLPYHKYDLFITSSAKDKDLIKFIDSISQALVQNGYSFSSIVKMINEDYSIAKKTEILERLEQEKEEQQQKQQEMEMQAKKEMQQAELDLEREKLKNNLDEEQIRTTAKLEIAKMNQELALSLQQFKTETIKYDVDKRTESKDKQVEVERDGGMVKQSKVISDAITENKKLILDDKDIILRNKLLKQRATKKPS